MIESSSGLLVEQVKHANGDSMKLLDNFVLCLLWDVAGWKCFRASTVCKRVIMTVQVVVDTIKLAFTNHGAVGCFKC